MTGEKLLRSISHKKNNLMPNMIVMPEDLVCHLCGSPIYHSKFIVPPDPRWYKTCGNDWYHQCDGHGERFGYAVPKFVYDELETLRGIFRAIPDIHDMSKNRSKN